MYCILLHILLWIMRVSGIYSSVIYVLMFCVFHKWYILYQVYWITENIWNWPWTRILHVKQKAFNVENFYTDWTI